MSPDLATPAENSAALQVKFYLKSTTVRHRSNFSNLRLTTPDLFLGSFGEALFALILGLLQSIDELLILRFCQSFPS